jgi:hypothetical protein
MNSRSELLSASGLGECTCPSALFSHLKDSPLVKFVLLSSLLVLRTTSACSNSDGGGAATDSSTEDDGSAAGNGVSAARGNPAAQQDVLAAMPAAWRQGRWRR